MIHHPFPIPSAEILSSSQPRFTPAIGVWEWALEAFLDESSEIFNQDHIHLADARIAFVWASYDEVRKGITVAGTAELNQLQDKRWTQGRQMAMFRDWNGGIDPDFVITLSAPFFAEADPVSMCAVVDHELYHCAQAYDKDGEPQFDSDDRPKWALRGHDVEEFVGVARRYGAWSPALLSLKDALDRKPLIGSPQCACACGCGALITSLP